MYDYLRGRREYCFVFLILIFFCFNANGENAETQYKAVQKTYEESTGTFSMALLRKYTNDPPRQLFLTEELPTTFRWNDLAGATLRLEFIIEFDGQQKYDSCTATLIQPNQVITAHHCIPGNEPWKVIKAKVVSYDSVRGILAQENVDLVSSPLLSSNTEDVSVLALSTPFPDSFKPYPMNIRSPIPGETLVIISYPLGQAKRLSSGNCRVGNDKTAMPSQFNHYCMTFPGSSGALVVAQTDGAVVGVHSQAFDAGAIANTLSDVKDVTNLKINKLSSPKDIDTSGSVLGAEMLARGFAEAIRNGESESWLKVMLNEQSNLNLLNKELKLTRTAIELDSVKAMNDLIAVGIELSANDATMYLPTKIHGPWTAEKQGMLNYLLKHNATVRLNPDTGLPIFCGPDVLTVVKNTFAENGHDQSKCHKP
ncbi:trypsin-like serine peptidase [Buttiauxella massiliensis]|uniref:trypsin-like serine peptidase n=1 Tax=Buttiauxella massiliensis TaxID=2831590 RepID=UPI00125F5203|nr:serine protease [Buttiauxella massiliensis]